MSDPFQPDPPPKPAPAQAAAEPGIRPLVFALDPARRSTHLVILFWCAWLLCSWLVCLLNASPRLAARLTMPFAALTGMMVLWPLIRLSTSFEPPSAADADPMPSTPPVRPSTHVLREWLYLNILLQAVLWPLMINAQWTLHQTLWLAWVFAAWSLLVGLVTAIGLRRGSAAARTLAMLGCLALLLVEPGIALLRSGVGAGQWLVSPIGLIRTLTTPFSPALRVEDAAGIIAVTAAGILGWLLYALLLRGRSA